MAEKSDHRAFLRRCLGLTDGNPAGGDDGLESDEDNPVFVGPRVADHLAGRAGRTSRNESRSAS
jgi:hypothetical protein